MTEPSHATTASAEFPADDGTRLTYRRLGRQSQAPVVVIGGGPCRDTEYLEDLAGLTAARELVILHGRGTEPTGGLSRGWWQDADDAAALIRHLDVGPVDLLAHSAGARVALATVAKSRHLVRSIALVTPAVTGLVDAEHDGAQIVQQRAGEPAVMEAVSALSGPPPTTQEEFDAHRAATAPAGYAFWDERQQAHDRLGACRLEAVAAFFTGTAPENASELIAAEMLDVPTLAVAGAADVFGSVQIVRALAERYQAEFALIDRCGHYPWVDQPEEFTPLLTRWWAGLD